MYWSQNSHKKRKQNHQYDEEDDDDDEKKFPFPLNFPKLNTNMNVTHNKIYFNDDILPETISELNNNLRSLDNKLVGMQNKFNLEQRIPIYLFLTTNGGSVYSALSTVDCIKHLTCPVYTIVEGFVASAGTLLSLSGEKKYIQANAYMLLHEIRSSFWGKMSEISNEYENIKKLTEHLISFYVEKTKISRQNMIKLLTKDITLNAQECIQKGLVDSIY